MVILLGCCKHDHPCLLGSLVGPLEEICAWS